MVLCFGGPTQTASLRGPFVGALNYGFHDYLDPGCASRKRGICNAQVGEVVLPGSSPNVHGNKRDDPNYRSSQKGP